MRRFAALIALLPIISWVLRKKNGCTFISPINLFTCIYLFSILIPILIYSNINFVNTINKYYVKNAVSNDFNFLKYTLLQTLCYYLVIFGTKVTIKNLNNEKKITSDYYNKESLSTYRTIGIVLWILGLIFFLISISKVGGVIYFFTNLQSRIFLMKKMSFTKRFIPLVQYGMLLFLYSRKNERKKLSIGNLFFIVLTGIISGLGGRKALILLFIQSIIIQHYCVRKINFKNLFRLRNILLLLLMYIYFILMSSLRDPTNMDLFIRNPINYIATSNFEVLSIIGYESYVPFYISLMNYFKSNSLWFGRTFYVLLIALIPSSIYPLKPPIDDGAYLYSICLGRTDINPPMPFSELDGSSFPLETFGSMYANFGLIGLFVGMIILGMIYGHYYRKIENNNFNLYHLYVYTIVMFEFQLSTLRIFQFIAKIVIFKVIYIIANQKYSFRRRI